MTTKGRFGSASVNFRSTLAAHDSALSEDLNTSKLDTALHTHENVAAAPELRVGAIDGGESISSAPLRSLRPLLCASFQDRALRFSLQPIWK